MSIKCRFCQENAIRFVVIGNGSNCLFDDLGFEGCVILNRIEFLERLEPGTYRVGSGFKFNRLGLQCSNEGFTGLEFAGGIPGTVGGAVYMNAGANGQVNSSLYLLDSKHISNLTSENGGLLLISEPKGASERAILTAIIMYELPNPYFVECFHSLYVLNLQETADVIDSVHILTTENKLQRLRRNELDFGYRFSPFQCMNDLVAIVGVTFRLQSSDSARARLLEYLERLVYRICSSKKLDWYC